MVLQSYGDGSLDFSCSYIEAILIARVRRASQLECRRDRLAELWLVESADCEPFCRLSLCYSQVELGLDGVVVYKRGPVWSTGTREHVVLELGAGEDEVDGGRSRSPPPGEITWREEECQVLLA